MSFTVNRDLEGLTLLFYWQNKKTLKILPQDFEKILFFIFLKKCLMLIESMQSLINTILWGFRSLINQSWFKAANA